MRAREGHPGALTGLPTGRHQLPGAQVRAAVADMCRVRSYARLPATHCICAIFCRARSGDDPWSGGFRENPSVGSRFPHRRRSPDVPGTAHALSVSHTYAGGPLSRLFRSASRTRVARFSLPGPCQTFFTPAATGAWPFRHLHISSCAGFCFSLYRMACRSVFAILIRRRWTGSPAPCAMAAIRGTLLPGGCASGPAGAVRTAPCGCRRQRTCCRRLRNVWGSIFRRPARRRTWPSGRWPRPTGFLTPV